MMAGQGRAQGGGWEAGGAREQLPVREAAARALSSVPGAFLRCDRGAALYVSDAPLRPGFDGPAIERALLAAGFCARPRGHLLEIAPMPPWPSRLTAWVLARARPDELYALLARPLPAHSPDAALALWLRGVKRMEMGAAAGEMRHLEQDLRAAVARDLRLGGGGGFADAAACLVYMQSIRRPDRRTRPDAPRLIDPRAHPRTRETEG